jgi:hypothetical protein
LACGAAAAAPARSLSAAPARGLIVPPSSLVKTKVRIPDGLANTYGSAVAAIGDLNGDGVMDFVVGERAANGNAGAAWVLFMRADGSVQSSVQISGANPPMGGRLHPDDEFGASVAAIGDLDGDGVPDIAVGAPNDDDVSPAHTGMGLGINRGALYLLLMTASGVPKSVSKLSDLTPGLSLPGDFERFGASVASLGDFDGVGPARLTLAVGAPGDADADVAPGFMRGAVYEVFLTWDPVTQLPAVQRTMKLSDTQGTPASLHLHDADLFGSSVARLADLNGDGVPDLVVGAPLDDDNADGDGPGANRGAVYVMLLNSDGTVNRYQKISATSGGFMAHLGLSSFFGDGVAALPDLDGDGVPDLAVGSGGYADGGAATGATWVVLLNYDHNTGAISVKQPLRISNSSGNLGGGLNPEDAFGASVASIGDLNGDGFPDLLAGAPGDGASPFGSAWVLDLGHSPVTLASAPNPSDLGVNVEFTAGVTPGTGTVEFLDGGAPLGISPLVSGTAIFDTNSLAVGSHLMTATYSGDSVNIGGTSPPYVQIVGTSTAALLAMFTANPGSDGIAVSWQLGDPAQVVSTALERAQDALGPWAAVTAPARTVDGVSSVLDADVVSGQTYQYRLLATGRDGSTQTLGQLSATAAQRVTAFALGLVSPNPAAGPVAMSFAVPQQSRVRLSLLDVQGREVATLADGVFTPGVYQVTWTGEGSRGAAPAGVYFVRYQTPGRTFTRRIVLAR